MHKNWVDSFSLHHHQFFQVQFAMVAKNWVGKKCQNRVAHSFLVLNTNETLAYGGYTLSDTGPLSGRAKFDMPVMPLLHVRSASSNRFQRRHSPQSEAEPSDEKENFERPLMRSLLAVNHLVCNSPTKIMQLKLSSYHDSKFVLKQYHELPAK